MVRARQLAATLFIERGIVRVAIPDAALHGSEQPHQIAGTSRNLEQLVGIRRIGNDRLVAGDAERKGAECLQAGERFA